MSVPYQPPSVFQAIWLIGRRAAVESLRDRTTLCLSLFFALVVPVGIVFLLIEPQSINATGTSDTRALGRLMAIYLLITGLGPSSGAISIAAGVFAGEKEKGNLAPLLATPASNTAIFAGKVLGAVLPALLYALLAEITYGTTLTLVRRRGPPRSAAAAAFAGHAVRGACHLGAGRGGCQSDLLTRTHLQRRANGDEHRGPADHGRPLWPGLPDADMGHRAARRHGRGADHP